MPALVARPPEKLRPFLFMGLDLDWEGQTKKVETTCPICGRDGKFAVFLDSGTCGCVVCKEAGTNAVTFLRAIWELSDKQTNGESKAFAAERNLLQPETLNLWGVVKSCVDGSWLVPGHNPDGALCQLYKRIWSKKDERWEMRPTPTLGHQMIGVPLLKKNAGTVHVHESWGNALAFWEVAGQAKETEDGLTVTASKKVNLLADASVLAVANCGAVGDPLKRFLPLFAGKRVVLWFDSDHPNERDGKTLDGAGFAAVKRFVEMLANADEPPSEVLWCKWGENGFDLDLKDGHDVRDALNTPDLAGRVKQLEALLAKVDAVPMFMVEAAKQSAVAKQGAPAEIPPLACSSWGELLQAWKKALVMSRSLADVLSVMLATGVSTSQQGDGQLFLMVVGEAGSAKTRLADAMLVSKTCHALEHLTGFYSGWKDSSGEDYSLLSRINHKTLITPEGDVLMSSPNAVQLMSQQRRIFDGTGGASYKNRKEDLRFVGLRTPWIICGTPAILNYNQAHLGDRFLKVMMEVPDEDARQSIIKRVGLTAWSSVELSSNCDPSSVVEERMLLAYRLTGGYLDYLRANATDLIAKVGVSLPEGDDSEAVVRRCGVLGEFTAIMRSRPEADLKKMDTHDAKELPTRLTHQFVRLARCLGAVLGTPVDADVMRRVRKVALDTSKGRVMTLCRLLRIVGDDGQTPEWCGVKTGHGTDKEKHMLCFLGRVKALERIEKKKGVGAGNRWRMTPATMALWDEVMGRNDDA